MPGWSGDWSCHDWLGGGGGCYAARIDGVRIGRTEEDGGETSDKASR